MLDVELIHVMLRTEYSGVQYMFPLNKPCKRKSETRATESGGSVVNYCLKSCGNYLTIP
jgi:hypothetical protein